eukprot:4624806-Pyramimonas_sp.AAC.1
MDYPRAATDRNTADHRALMSRNGHGRSRRAFLVRAARDPMTQDNAGGRSEPAEWLTRQNPMENHKRAKLTCAV